MSSEESSKEIRAQYHRDVFRKILLIIIGIVATGILAVFSCSVNTGVSMYDSYKIIVMHILGDEFEIGSVEWIYDLYIWDRVVPSVAMAVTAGIGLAVAGTAMQAITTNPLADAYTTGISSGACFGAVSAIVVGATFSFFNGQYGIISMAFLGGLIPALLVIVLARYVGNSPATLILLGVSLSYFFNGMTTFMMITTDTDTLQTAYLWQVGSLTRAGWDGVKITAVISIIGAAVFLLLSGKFNLLSLGDASAKSLGLDVGRFRFLVLVLISFLVSAIIAYTGILGFVGLVSPHIARFLVGDNNRFVIPASMVFATIMLTIANIGSRYLLDITTVPVGVVLSFIGAPLFLYLIVRRKSRNVIY